MKKIQISLLATAFLFSPMTWANCSDTVSEKQISKYKTVIKDFGKTLKQELQKAMKEEGGAVHAVSVCNTSAGSVTDDYAKKNNFELKRISLKNRNADNVPDEWETNILKEFEKRKSTGEAVATLDHAEVVETDGKRQIRYVKAIGTAPLCLTCHGATLAAPVANKIDELYPKDLARGFKAGDIRGAFSITETIEKCE